MSRTALLVAALLACTGCGGSRPTSADLDELLAEAAALDYYDPIPAHPTAREAVREALRKMLELDQAFTRECGKRAQRPELQSYLLRAEAYIGGTFPRGTAELLREMQQLENDYLAELPRFPELLALKLAQSDVPAGDRQALVDEFAGVVATRWRPVVAAVEAHRAFAVAAAELYELVAARPESLRAMRTGLEFSDATLEEDFDAQARVVDDAHEASQRAFEVLDTQSGGMLNWIGLTKRVGR